MKSTIFILLLSLLVTNQAFAGGQEWVEDDRKHPLWDKMRVKPTKIEHRYLKIQEKTIGKISCRRTGADGDLIATTCVFPDNLTSTDVYEFYQKLDVQPVETKSAFTALKIIDRLIVVGDSDQDMNRNSSRLYLDHPCRSVREKESASACMEFWAGHVLPAFDDPNNNVVVEKSDEVKARARQALEWTGYTGEKLKNSNEQLEKAAFIGLMEEHQQSHRLFHFAIERGENIIPREIFQINEVDLTTTPLALRARQVPLRERDPFIATALNTLLLGQDSALFRHFADGARQSLERLIDKNN